MFIMTRQSKVVAAASCERLMHWLLLVGPCVLGVKTVTEGGNARRGAVQKLLLLRKDMAAREAQLREEAAAARGEAEAAAQLVHALQPKGDFVLGTLWTKVTPKLPRPGTVCSCRGLKLATRSTTQHAITPPIILFQG